MTKRDEMRDEAKKELVGCLQEVVEAVAKLPPEEREAALADVRKSMREAAAAMFARLDRSSPQYVRRAEAIVDAIVELGTDAAAVEERVRKLLGESN